MYSKRLFIILSLLALLLSFSEAAKPTSFCKCTCGSESEIVALDEPASQSPSLARFLFARQDSDSDGGEDGDGDGSKDEKKVFQAKTCTDCNRQFCVDNNLPGCRTVDQKDIFTMCFQRDSAKDQAVVFIFIIATVSLLGWSLIRPWLGSAIQKYRERRSYIPISEDNSRR